MLWGAAPRARKGIHTYPRQGAGPLVRSLPCTCYPRTSPCGRSADALPRQSSQLWRTHTGMRYGSRMNGHDRVLTKFRSAIADAYGARIERIVLYGSRARGDAHLESDYDIAVFLTDLSNRWQEVRRIADIELALLDETGATVHAMPYPAQSWRDPASPLMYEIRKDGLDL